MKSPVAFYSGLTVVFGTHVYMLYAGLPQSQMNGHAYINLVAGGLILYGGMD